jgi:alpha,alpha-trehalose phosphorylase
MSAVQAAIFDMDGVVTRTARLHAAAWKELFDGFLAARAGNGGPFRPFDEAADYRAHVDGKPRREGVKSFLRARGIALGEEEEEALAKRKDGIFEQRLREQGVETFASTVALIEALRERGVKTGVVTSSRHGREMLEAAGLAQLFDARLDGIDLEERGLKGKPDPETFVTCAEALGAAPGRAVVFEDALAGVQAARRGGFGLVVGVDRGGSREALERSGADLVVEDLAELDPERLDAALGKRQEERAWRVEQEGFDSTREHAMESLFTVGNGYLGVRGALDSPLAGSQCDLFVAGVYDRKRDDLPYSEIEFLAPQRDHVHAELAPLPSPLRMSLRVAGEPLDFAGSHGHELRRILEMRHGTLVVEAAYETPGGRRTAVRTRRCASLVDPHLLLHETLVTPENHSSALELEAALWDEHVGRHPHIERRDAAGAPGVELLRLVTRASGLEVCIASRLTLRGSGEDKERWEVEGRIGEPLVFRRFVSVFTSRDADDPGAAALAHLQSLRREEFDALLADHACAWQRFWSAADIRVADRPATEQALRFGSYHLRIAASGDPRDSVPARALTGRAYEGHVFWDAEIFMLPFYLHTVPEHARALLLYRHHTLEGARRRARELGHRGACFAWESTVTGEDVTPREIVLKSTGKRIPIFTGTQQLHVTAGVAYAAWRYWEATRDEAFLAGPGAELLVETARFWASRAVRGERHHHIRGVVGPDEYHHSVNDNAYTNWMARFNLERAAWLAGSLEGKRRAGLLEEREPEAWSELARQLYCPEPDARGVIEQFEGFFALEDYRLADEERGRAPVHRLFDWERINRLKLIKQADVLMLPFLFPEAFSDEIVAANYRYYEPLTDHASSLSPAVHAAIAARLGLAAEAERYWRQSLWLDLSNTMDNSALGVHPACMGGTWQALVRGFLGVRFSDAGPQADPRAGERLPEAWRSVALQLAWRGERHAIEVSRKETRA